jgi:5-methylcytosine-specific restriction endonuclease McrA
VNVPVSNLRTLVLNADLQPLSWAPLSIWNWQDAFVAVAQDRVMQIKAYDGIMVRSARQSFEVPAVVALKSYRKRKSVAFTRYHLFLRDEFKCQYCGQDFHPKDLTFDHVIPRSRGGLTSWDNIVACCGADNLRKRNLTPAQAGMHLRRQPFEPSPYQLDTIGRRVPASRDDLHQTWLDFLYWDSELEA